MEQQDASSCEHVTHSLCSIVPMTSVEHIASYLRCPSERSHGSVTAGPFVVTNTVFAITVWAICSTSPLKMPAYLINELWSVAQLSLLCCDKVPQADINRRA